MMVKCKFVPFLCIMYRLKIFETGLLLLCMVAIHSLSFATVTSISHFTGTVSFFDGKKVIADGREYQIIEGCVYFKHTRRNNAFFEDKASSREVRSGDSVILHINGNIVDKVIIEEWKQ